MPKASGESKAECSRVSRLQLRLRLTTTPGVRFGLASETESAVGACN
jgi:hypothetical protein